MIKVGSTTPAQVGQAETSSAQATSFAGRNVSVAGQSTEQFIPSLELPEEHSLSQPRDIQTIRIRQPYNRGEERQHFMTSPSLQSQEYEADTLADGTGVRERAGQLAQLSTPISEIEHFIQQSYNDNHISDKNEETFTTLADYNQILDKQMLRMADLADKLNNSKITAKEAHELNALLKLNKNNLSVVQGHLSTLMGGSLTPEESALASAFETRFAERHMDLANLMTEFSDILPQQEPVSREERVGYSLMQARGCLSAIENMNVPGLSEAKHERIKDAARQHCQRLEQHLKFATGQHDPEQDELSLDLLTEDFTLVKDKKKLSSSVLSPLNQRWDNFNNRSRLGQDDAIPLAHPKISQPTMMRLFVEHQLKSAGVAKQDMPDVEFLLKQGIVEEINNKEWPIVDKEIAFKVNGQAHFARSKMTPAMYLATHFGESYSSNGISSMDRMQYKHVPNMAHSEMTAVDGEIMFSGIRHGVLDPYTVNDKNLKKLPNEQLSTMIKELLLDTGVVETPSGQHPKDYSQILAQQVKAGESEIPDLANKLREESSKMMAKELLTAAVVSDPKKLRAALNGEQVPISLNSISLVTPDMLRASKKPGSPSDEKTMLMHQSNSLKALAASGEAVSLEVRDEAGTPRKIKVIPKVRTFNFGVNKGAVATSYKVLGPRTPFWGKAMGWEFAAGMNNPELRDLLGDPRSRELGGAVAAKVAEMSESTDETVQRRANLLSQAATQAKEIWNSGSFRRGGREPYKMVSRLALVSHLMGESTLYNCKSGKDRTGQLDAEVKYLAAVGKTTGQIPRPEAAHTTESRRMRTNFTLNSGNHEMQQMTVGLKGYKLSGVPGINKMLREDMMDVYRGGSAFVKT